MSAVSPESVPASPMCFLASTSATALALTEKPPGPAPMAAPKPIAIIGTAPDTVVGTYPHMSTLLQQPLSSAQHRSCSCTCAHLHTGTDTGTVCTDTGTDTSCRTCPCPRGSSLCLPDPNVGTSCHHPLKRMGLSGQYRMARLGCQQRPRVCNVLSR